MDLTRRGRIDSFYFVSEQGVDGVPGGDTVVSVYADYEGEGVPVLERPFYFEERTAEHIDNFCRDFAFDAHYREVCLAGRAHWRRVAALYDLNAKILAREGRKSGEALLDACRRLFHYIRRDLSEIEGRPEFQAEMARQRRGEETGLGRLMDLLAKVPGLKATGGCQGCAALQIGGIVLFLPSCHTEQARVTFSALPPGFLSYLQGSPLGQRRLFELAANEIRSARVTRNRAFIRALADATGAYLRKSRR